jgi:glycosyltransferase involved in cell wall biosynthesis
VLVDLISNPDKRREIGRRSREFAVKWHSADAGARRLDTIYRNLLDGRPGTDDLR